MCHGLEYAALSYLEHHCGYNQVRKSAKLGMGEAGEEKVNMDHTLGSSEMKTQNQTPGSR